MDDSTAVIIAKALLEIVKQLEKLNKTMEDIRDDGIKASVSGGIDTRSY